MPRLVKAKEEPAAPVKKTRTKAKPVREEAVFVQFGADEWNTAEIREKVIAAYVAEGHRESSVKRLRLYIKPEDRKAYYVVNEKVSGSVDL